MMQWRTAWSKIPAAKSKTLHTSMTNERMVARFTQDQIKSTHSFEITLNLAKLV